MKIVFFLLGVASFLFGFQNSIGVAYLHSPTIYTKTDDTNTFFPALFYENEYLYFRGIELGYKYNPNISFILRPNFNTREIEGLEDKKQAFSGGVEFTQKIDSYKISLNLLHDISNAHNGTQSSLKLSKTFVNYPFIITPSLGVEYEDKKVSNYYFGVEPNPTYPKYEAKESLSPVVGVMGIYNINKTYSIFLLANNKFLSKNITDSPIVEKSNKSMILASILYKF